MKKKYIGRLALTAGVSALSLSAWSIPLELGSVLKAVNTAQTGRALGNLVPTEWQIAALAALPGQVTAPAQIPIQAAGTPQSRALPSPLQSPPQPLTDWVINGSEPIGENWDASSGWLEKQLFGKSLEKSRIHVYGWIDAGFTRSTSDHSDTPLSYGFYPNRPVLDQAILKVEREPDTVQTDHEDWGFRFTSLYGTDYRFTAADGWLFDQLQKRNALYGYDPVELFVEKYFPKIYEGAVLQVGRYISPPDIEAQLAPQNYLYSHSVMFTYDPYTYTGANLQTRLSKYWTLMTGIQAGNDKAPWEKSAAPNAEIMVGWNDHSNNDSIWTGFDSIGRGKFKAGHDDMQVFSTTWGHKFDNKWHMQTQFYYIWGYDNAKGGTEIDGPTEPYAGGGGAGPIIPGQSHSVGAVNYLIRQLTDKDYLCYRTDLLNDPQGWRTGAANVYTSYTLGWCHYFNPNLFIRPEIRFDNASLNPAYDNGTRKTQWTLATDVIFKF